MDHMQPFDAAASTYDETFTKRKLGIWLRDMVRSYVPFEEGDHVLEVGCGTGEDAVWLAQRGVQVTATDISSAMLAQARQKIETLNLFSLIELSYLDMNEPQVSSLEMQYDGVFSNFGAVNCVADRNQLARYLADQVRENGTVILVMMGRLCLWEIGWYLLHGDTNNAFRRLKSGELAHVGGGDEIRVWFPAPAQLRRDFAPWFRHECTVGIGTLLPPSYLDHLVERWQRPFAAIASIDRQLGRYLFSLSDHYLVIFKRA